MGKVFFIKIFIGIACLSSCSSFEKASRLHFQIPVEKAILSQTYKPHHRKVHLGIDLKANKGSPVLSIEKGLVVYVGRQFTGYGKLVIIEHSLDWTSLYAHLDSFQVHLGQKIKKGQKIGRVGNTGRSTGTHLHLELFYQKKNVNPLDYIPIKK